MSIAKFLSWEAAPNVYAFKYPDTNLATWSQLIVNESQEAILFKDGQAIGPFGPGRHVLSTENYPVLAQLLHIANGEKTNFFAEVWFVRMNANLDVKWGTGTPIQLEDPKYHIMLPVRAFGQFGIRVEDSMKFLIKLVGTMPAFTQTTLTNYFRGMVVMRAKETISRYLVDGGVSILQLGARLGEIGEKMEKSLAEMFSEYGLGLANFALASVGTDDQDPAVARLRRAMAERAEMEILGDRYQMKRSFDTMDAAASNAGGSGGMAGAGMGFGMGMGMGGAMFGMSQQMAANLSAQPVSGMVGVTSLPAAAPATAPKFCPNCGTALATVTRFCPNCGNKLS